jgi:hypothetical protein
MPGRPKFETARKAIADLMADDSVPMIQTIRELDMLKDYIDDAKISVLMSESPSTPKPAPKPGSDPVAHSADDSE